MSPPQAYSAEARLPAGRQAGLDTEDGAMAENKPYYGDNLAVLRDRHYFPDESVDLVYLDPPFNSNQAYNVLFQERNGSQSAAQIKAFEDTWRWSLEAEAAYRELVEAVETPGPVSQFMRGMRSFLGENDMMAYLSMMAPRLVELRRVLKPTGSIYLHCDPTASAHLRLLMDAVFAPEQFRNEIIWRRTGSHNSPKRYGPIHDTLLFYSKTDEYWFRPTHRPYLSGHVKQYFRQQDERGPYWTNALTGAGTRTGASGKPWRTYDPTRVGRHWAIPGRLLDELGLKRTLSTQDKLDALDAAGLVCHPADESRAMPTYRQYLDASSGMPVQDIWAYQPHTHGVLYGTDQGIDEDVRWLVAQGAKERLGYPTQKPLALLERIIRASSNEGDMVLDPFCGCGTAVVAAQKLGRRWIGIDVTHLAVTLIKHRLRDTFPDKVIDDKAVRRGVEYDVVGEPADLAGAAALAMQDPIEFQRWAVGLVGAGPRDPKKGADRGIDGRLNFHDEADTRKTKQVILQVKAGHVGVKDVRELMAVVEREKAQMGALISLQEPTRPMVTEAAAAGFYKHPVLEAQYPRIQLLTVREILRGTGIEYPPRTSATFKRAPRARGPKGHRQAELGEQ
jgi:site-specific DNA-methyltransferase (adenine-specific)